LSTNQHTWIISSSTLNSWVFLPNILLYLVNIHLLTISKICYLQLSKYFLAYFYLYLDLYHHLYSNALYSQEHLYSYFSIFLLFDWSESYKQAQLSFVLVILPTILLLSVAITTSLLPVSIFLLLPLSFLPYNPKLSSVVALLIAFVQQVDIYANQV